MNEILDFWALLKKRPLTALGAVLMLAIVTIGWEVFEKRIMAALEPPPAAPFADLAGAYSGKTETVDFVLCLNVLGSQVRGSMTWPGIDPENRAYVRYRGQIFSDHVQLEYKRNRDHPDSDKGDAVIARDAAGRYVASWENWEDGRGEIFPLTKIASSCKPIGW